MKLLARGVCVIHLSKGVKYPVNYFGSNLWFTKNFDLKFGTQVKQ